MRGTKEMINPVHSTYIQSLYSRSRTGVRGTKEMISSVHSTYIQSLCSRSRTGLRCGLVAQQLVAELKRRSTARFTYTSSLQSGRACRQPTTLLVLQHRSQRHRINDRDAGHRLRLLVAIIRR